MSIYSANNDMVLNEFGFTKSQNSTDRFRSVAEDVLTRLDKFLGDCDRCVGLLSKDKDNDKMKGSKSYQKSVEKARSQIKKHSDNGKIKYSLNISDMSIWGEYAVAGKVSQGVLKALVDAGFKSMVSSKKFIKRLTQSYYMYKEISDDLIIVVQPNVGFTTNYGQLVGYDYVSITMIATVPDDKTMKKLNLSESGVFESVRFI